MISVPVTYGDIVAYGAQMAGSADSPGAIMGFIHKLPSGNIEDQFRVGSPRPGMKFKEVMGAQEEDDDGPLAVDPEEEPIDDEETIAAEIEETELEIAEVEIELQEVETQLRTEIDPASIDRLRTKQRELTTEIEKLMRTANAARLTSNIALSHTRGVDSSSDEVEVITPKPTAKPAEPGALFGGPAKL